MKKFLFLVLALPILALAQTPEEDIIGTWEGSNLSTNGKATFIFDAEGYVLIDMDGTLVGGKEFEDDGVRGSIAYKLNTTTDPKQLEIVFTDLDSGMTDAIPFIFEFKSKDVLKLESSGKTPLTNFSENSIDFKRVVQ